MIEAVIVEDDRMVAAINSQFIEKTPGIQLIAVFHNGRDALAFLEKRKIDLLLLDVYMPEISGLELLERIRSKNRTMDVIMITAANDPEHLQQSLRLGITDYLVKPFRYERFAEALDKVILRKKVIDSGLEFTQEDIDQILSVNKPRESSKVMELEKGLQRRTLEKIRSCLREHQGEPLTAEQISSESDLSKITVRRYLNYFIELGEVSSSVDYSTGGRPRILYKFLR